MNIICNVSNIFVAILLKDTNRKPGWNILSLRTFVFLKQICEETNIERITFFSNKKFLVQFLSFQPRLTHFIRKYLIDGKLSAWKRHYFPVLPDLCQSSGNSLKLVSQVPSANKLGFHLAILASVICAFNETFNPWQITAADFIFRHTNWLLRYNFDHFLFYN